MPVLVNGPCVTLSSMSLRHFTFLPNSCYFTTKNTKWSVSQLFKKIYNLIIFYKDLKYQTFFKCIRLPFFFCLFSSGQITKTKTWFLWGTHSDLSIHFKHFQFSIYLPVHHHRSVEPMSFLRSHDPTVHCLHVSMCLQVYASTSGDDYARDGGGYPSAKPGAVYPGSFYMQGIFFHDIPDIYSICNPVCECIFILANMSLPYYFSEDPWSSSGYSAMLGNSSHIGQPGSFSAINPQDRMVGRNVLNPILVKSWCFA